MATGLLNLSEKVNGKKVKNTYYFNKSGVMQTGWQYVNKNYYYFDTKTGRAYKGTKKLDGYTLTFSDKGVWDQKLYNNGKDVTTDALKEKLTGIKQVVKNPDTITIKGQEYSTKLTKLTLNQANLTDEDLEPLKYMTKLKQLNIVPGNYIGGDVGLSNVTYWDYKDIKYMGTKTGKYNGKTYYMYEGTRTVRNIAIDITNIDFCKYMSKLENITVAYAPKLTDLKGLQDLKKLQSVDLFNCVGLKDLHDLDAVNFVCADDISGVTVTFTDNVNFLFNDYYYGKRLSPMYYSEFSVIATTENCTNSVQFKFNVAVDNPQILRLIPNNGSLYRPKYSRQVGYLKGELIHDYTA